MIKLLTGSHQKKIAWFLLLVFYGESLAFYAYAKNKHAVTEVSSRFDWNLIPSVPFPVDPAVSEPVLKEVQRAEADLQNPNEILEDQEQSEDIGGPGQPEMSSFKSVGADNMVNLFTGDFSYSIPLLDVGGYPVNLFYNAGVTMDQEASWVGLGWNINPGTITRNMRGLPDDYNGDDLVTRTQSMKPDVTVGVSGNTGKEIVGAPNYHIGAGIFYNNKRGIGLEADAGFDYSPLRMVAQNNKDENSAKDTLANLSLSAGVSLNSQNGMSMSGGVSIYKYDKEEQINRGLSTSIGFNSREGFTGINISGEARQYIWASLAQDCGAALYARNGASAPISNIGFARPSYTPTIRMPLTTINQLYSVKIGRENKILFKNGTISGYLNTTRIAKSDQVQTRPAFGYMYFDKALDNERALLDFNRMQDGVYTLKKPVISIPTYTYDVFSITGEGTGGSFRGYRGNMGYIRDHDSKTKSGSGTLSFDLGAGKDLFHGGIILGGVFASTDVNEWKDGNALRYQAKFNPSSADYQGFYFRNPGEQAIVDETYYNKLGGDQLIRPYLTDIHSALPMLASGFQVFGDDGKVSGTVTADGTSKRNTRDKRTQVISYLTAEEADMVGLDRYIYSYKENTFLPGSCAGSVRTSIKRWNPLDNKNFYRKKNHLSEIDVLEADGRRFVYGIPVYVIKQNEINMSVSGGSINTTTNQTSYTDKEKSQDNDSGQDGLYDNTETGGYAHSFLLSSILSPDYIDVTGDGISDDDKGTAVKFNYSKVNMKKTLLQNSWNAYKWRMPVGNHLASYNEGLKANPEDDMGLFTYGEKELWYMHSIESKNMVATFYVSDRRDGNPVAGINGGLDNSTGRTLQKKLDSIRLFTKADYAKYGANARPIKTVRFEYDYSLCPDYALNDGTTVTQNGNNINQSKGKLTLKAIWFNYNGNSNQVKNKYKFQYSSTNPSYNPAENDRWGNYKPHSQNPDNGVGNNDYPYTSQNSTNSNIYASAWNLEKILLPGGAVMQVEYEADDYGFVQNKRASQMTQIAGFSGAPNQNPSNTLYTWSSNPVSLAKPGLMDHRFVFFDLPQALNTKAEIATNYLQDMKQLLLRLWVKMPKGNVGQNVVYEPVTIYGRIKDYDFAITNGSVNHSRIYVELEKTDREGSPIMQTVMQFLKDQLPSRAYPGYDVKQGNTSGFVQLVRAVFGMMNALTQGVMGFEKNLKAAGKCKEFKAALSFARLNNPGYKKIGGGHRIKKVTINDNWNRMTGQYDSYYGQEYDYTTTEDVSGQSLTISSGVATYEPGIGNEENPFREVLAYSEQQFLGPTDHSNVELPLAEMFFPSPMIGYSRVSVKSIHNKDNKNIKSGVGLQQTEFYTSREFPAFSDFTPFDEHSRQHHKPRPIQRVFNFDKRDYMTLTQGVRVVLNDMNGKLRSQTSYAENDLKTPINFTGYYYRLAPNGNGYKLDNKVRVISGPDGKINEKLIGRDVEVMNDFREHLSYTRSLHIPLNVDIFKVANFPLIIPSLFRMAFRDKSLYRSATTLKVVNEYGIIDSVVNIDKGSVVGTKNLVFDAETGGVLISRTNNEFKRAIYQFNYPAWWVNSGMEPAYKNIDVTYENVLFRNGRIEESSHVNMNLFESGDEILVIDQSAKGVLQSTACVQLGDASVLPLSNEHRIWAVDIRKDTRNNTKEFIFIDRNGNPYNAAKASIRIIRSGKRNLTGVSAGSIVSFSSPIRQYTLLGQTLEHVVIDNATDVINASAAEFREKWRTNDMFYAKDSIVAVVRQAPISTAELSAETVIAAARSQDIDFNDIFFNVSSNTKVNIHKSRWLDAGRHRRFDDENAWLKFNLPSGLSGATVISANIKLNADRLFHSPAYPTTGAFINNHNVNQPHYNGKDEGTGYNNTHLLFQLARMTTPWYNSSNTTGWRSAFDYLPANPVITGLRSWYPGPFSWDFNVNIKDIFQGFANNMGDPNIATGIKFNFYTNSRSIQAHKPNNRWNPVWHYCFEPFTGSTPGVKVNLSYYKCESSNPIVYTGSLAGAPVTPPAGYMYCPTLETYTFCLSSFSKHQMNPYVEGVLGNWRGWRSYVYYGERRESDPTVATDIRKDGIINNFEAYWAFDNNNIQLAKTNSTKWVWNSEITQYNRKGAELEDHDPLNRYNAGIYGYQESLPIAVISNSRLRLSAFDGFEDYSYKDDPCEPFCKPSKRHFPTGITGTMLDGTLAHTGKYSAKVNSNTTYTMDIKMSVDDTETVPDIRIKLDKTAVQQVVQVNPRGIGLKGYYYNTSNWTGSYINRVDPSQPQYARDINMNFRAKSNGDCYNRDWDDPPAGINCAQMSIQWKGFIQVTSTGYYEFMSANADDESYIHIYDQSNNDNLVATDIWGGAHSRTPIYLSAGVLYKIRIDFRQFNGYGSVQLQWKVPGQTRFTPIDMKYLYPEGQENLAIGTTVTQTAYCEKPDDIQAIDHHLIDSLNFLANKKMVVSVWVRKGSIDCKCSNYTGVHVKVKDANGNLLEELQAKEKIIEGWQLFEAVFTTPSTGDKVKLEFTAAADAALYFDDLRLHPFNANMKSFVYDPVNLRLAAELDENNYASFYEYDDDGTLVRTKKETRQGIKTIIETRSANQKNITDFQ